MKMRGKFTLTAAVALLLFGCSGGPDGPLELKFGHVGAPGSLYALSAEEFARRANERLGDQANVLVYGSSQLGGDEVLMQKLKLGTVDFALPSSIMSSTEEAFGLFEMPYLVRDRDHMGRIEEEIFWPQMEPLLEEIGFNVIAVWENGFRHVTNSVRPVATPDDLAGIKLRTPRGIWRVKMFQTYGANPSPMPLSEVFVALQTGVMDGQENPLQQIVSSKFQEVQRYLSLTRHVYSPAYVAVGTNRWNRLPEDVRQVLEETARETQAFVYETAARMEEELLQELRDANVEVNAPDASEFIAASETIYAEFRDTVPGGEELLDHAQQLAEN